MAQPRVSALMSDEHVSVDGTLIQAWASHKSFQPKPDADGDDPPSKPSDPRLPGIASGRNAEQSWRGHKRSNETHCSTTAPDARLVRKSNGQASILAYAGRRVSKLGVVRRSGVDGRTQRHSGCTVSQRVRKRIEEVFGWVKSSAGFRQTKHRGRQRVAWCFDLVATAYNLIRLPKPLAAVA